MFKELITVCHYSDSLIVEILCTPSVLAIQRNGWFNFSKLDKARFARCPDLRKSLS